jgi:hypothetical protein
MYYGKRDRVLQLFITRTNTAHYPSKSKDNNYEYPASVVVNTDGEGVGNDVRGRAVSKIMGGGLLELGLPSAGKGAGDRPLAEMDEISAEA